METPVFPAHIQAALDRAQYEIIEDEQPYYGEVPQLPGVWATGPTLESCRTNLSSAVEDWLLFSVANVLDRGRVLTEDAAS